MTADTVQERKAASETTSTSRAGRPYKEPIIKAPQRKPRDTASMPSVSSKISVKVRREKRNLFGWRGRILFGKRRHLFLPANSDTDSSSAAFSSDRMRNSTARFPRRAWSCTSSMAAFFRPQPSEGSS